MNDTHNFPSTLSTVGVSSCVTPSRSTAAAELRGSAPSSYTVSIVLWRKVPVKGETHPRITALSYLCYKVKGCRRLADQLAVEMRRAMGARAPSDALSAAETLLSKWSGGVTPVDRAVLPLWMSQSYRGVDAEMMEKDHRKRWYLMHRELREMEARELQQWCAGARAVLADQMGKLSVYMSGVDAAMKTVDD